MTAGGDTSLQKIRGEAKHYILHSPPVPCLSHIRPTVLLSGLVRFLFHFLSGSYTFWRKIMCTRTSSSKQYHHLKSSFLNLFIVQIIFCKWISVTCLFTPKKQNSKSNPQNASFGFFEIPQNTASFKGSLSVCIHDHTTFLKSH